MAASEGHRGSNSDPFEPVAAAIRSRGVPRSKSCRAMHRMAQALPPTRNPIRQADVQLSRLRQDGHDPTLPTTARSVKQDLGRIRLGPQLLGDPHISRFDCIVQREFPQRLALAGLQLPKPKISIQALNKLDFLGGDKSATQATPATTSSHLRNRCQDKSLHSAAEHTTTHDPGIDFTN